MMTLLLEILDNEDKKFFLTLVDTIDDFDSGAEVKMIKGSEAIGIRCNTPDDDVFYVKYSNGAVFQRRLDQISYRDRPELLRGYLERYMRKHKPGNQANEVSVMLKLLKEKLPKAKYSVQKNHSNEIDILKADPKASNRFICSIMVGGRSVARFYGAKTKVFVFYLKNPKEGAYRENRVTIDLADKAEDAIDKAVDEIEKLYNRRQLKEAAHLDAASKQKYLAFVEALDDIDDKAYCTIFPADERMVRRTSEVGQTAIKIEFSNGAVFKELLRNIDTSRPYMAYIANYRSKNGKGTSNYALTKLKDAMIEKLGDETGDVKLGTKHGLVRKVIGAFGADSALYTITARNGIGYQVDTATLDIKQVDGEMTYILKDMDTGDVKHYLEADECVDALLKKFA